LKNWRVSPNLVELQTTTNNYSSFAQALDLQPGADGLFIGKLGGFPVGLKFIDPPGGLLLLFQIRHWLKADAPQLKSVVYDSDITGMLADKKLEIEFDERIAWLTLAVQDDQLESTEVLRALNSVLKSFETAHLIGDPDLCHYCQKQRVDTLSSAEGKVAQICPACLDERLNKRDKEAVSTGRDAVPIFLMSPGAAIVGALLWAVFWIGHTVLFEHLNSDRIFIPRIVVISIMAVVGFFVGGPVGWIIKQNRRRGKAASASAAILFASLAVVAGEICYLAWFIYHEFGFFSLSAAVHVMPTFYGENDPMFLAEKALTGFVCVAVAYAIAKPTEPKLKL